MKFRIAHIFCGIGGKGLGAREAVAAFGDASATFETIGGIDVDPRACRDFEMLVGAPSLCADVHDLEPADLIRFFGPVAPDVVMLSPPCKGFSGLLSAKRATEPKYQRMNALMERALFLIASTWPTPPKLVFVENVPRIASRGRDTVRRCLAIGESAGYAVTTGTHDCGELGALAQHRRRWFMLWRHRAQVAQFVYEPAKHRVLACGDVLGPLPMPGDVERGGPMHTVPRLSYRNWLRLALIPAGGDWRDLPGTLEDGQARREVFRRSPVTPWGDPAETVTGPGGSASAAVADPRVALPGNESRHWNKYAVTPWDHPTPTVIGAVQIGSGAPSVADPRVQFGHVDRVTPWSDPVGTITRAPAPSSGAGAVADPRWGGGRLGVTSWGEPTGTVAGESLPNNGAFSVADPRFADGKKKNWQQVAGVTPWTEPAPTVTSGAKIHAGAFQVADPRVERRLPPYRVMTLAEALALDLPLDKAPPFVPVIVAEDGTWHRPLTTLELAVLQSFPQRLGDAPLVLDGTSHTRWREAIGNAVPPRAGRAVAEQMLKALLLSTLGVFALDNNPIWVAPERRAMVI